MKFWDFWHSRQHLGMWFDSRRKGLYDTLGDYPRLSYEYFCSSAIGAEEDSRILKIFLKFYFSVSVRRSLDGLEQCIALETRIHEAVRVLQVGGQDWKSYSILRSSCQGIFDSWSGAEDVTYQVRNKFIDRLVVSIKQRSVPGGGLESRDGYKTPSRDSFVSTCWWPCELSPTFKNQSKNF